MRIRIATAFGIGYVLGAKAGRQRYEEIRRTAEKVQSDPRVQDAAQRAEAAVREATARVQGDPRVEQAAATVRETVEQKVGQATASLRQAQEAAAETTRKTGKAETTGKAGGTGKGGAWPAHPDEHVEASEDELVHSVGPDVEESIEELGGPGAHRA